MSEKQLSLPEIFLVVLDFVVVGVVVFFLFLLLLSFKVNVTRADLQRTTIELAENLLSSPLTEGKFILDKAELDKFDNTIAEPYVRHCNYAYHLDIDAKKKMNGKDSWSFGYKTNQFAHANRLEDFSFETPVSIKGTEGKGTVLVAGKMKITVYDTIVGRVDCMIENAFGTKEVQNMPLPCNNDKSRFCDLAIDKAAGKICFVTDYRKFGKSSDPDTECRMIDGKFAFSGIAYSFERDGKKRSLNAVPVKSLPADIKECNQIEHLKAGKTDQIAGIALCIEEEGK